MQKCKIGVSSCFGSFGPLFSTHQSVSIPVASSLKGWIRKQFWQRSTFPHHAWLKFSYTKCWLTSESFMFLLKGYFSWSSFSQSCVIGHAKHLSDMIVPQFMVCEHLLGLHSWQVAIKMKTKRKIDELAHVYANKGGVVLLECVCIFVAALTQNNKEMGSTYG